MSKKLVAVTIVAIFVGILVWDAFLYGDGVARNSITQVIIDLSKQSALVPWFVGIVMGFLGAHLFDTSEQGGDPDRKSLVRRFRRTLRGLLIISRPGNLVEVGEVKSALEAQFLIDIPEFE